MPCLFEIYRGADIAPRQAFDLLVLSSATGSGPASRRDQTYAVEPPPSCIDSLDGEPGRIARMFETATFLPLSSATVLDRRTPGPTSIRL